MIVSLSYLPYTKRFVRALMELALLGYMLANAKDVISLSMPPT
jgi:hypothetical protein